MASILFIGVGTMGYPMATNLVKNKHNLNFYDPYALEKNIKNLKTLGCIKIESLKNIPNNLDFVITMLPTGKEVKEVTIGNYGIFNYTKDNFIYIDMSTILPKDSIEISQQLKKKGYRVIRFWESELENYREKCIQKIYSSLSF